MVRGAPATGAIAGPTPRRTRPQPKPAGMRKLEWRVGPSRDVGRGMEGTLMGLFECLQLRIEDLDFEHARALATATDEGRSRSVKVAFRF